MTKKWITFGITLAFAISNSSASAQNRDHLSATGSIDTSFDGIIARGIAVSVNGRPVELDDEGLFTSKVEISPYFQLRADGPAIHATIQTFGIAEVYHADCNCLRFPPVEVVARKKGRIEVLFAGDAMAGRRYIEPIWAERPLIDPADPLPDMESLLEPISPYIESADLASVNLEIVLSDRDFGNAPPKSVTFYAPPALAQALSNVGFDYVTLGNNHSYDFLEQGLASTIAAVEAAGLAWSGAGHDEAQALRPSRLEVRDQSLSLLGYVGWKGTVEPNQIAETGKGGAAFGSDENISATVHREVTQGRIVIVQYHGSREYSDEPTEESEGRMKLAIDSGAALVASHHPHVPQGLEIYNGALIAYSTGNFLFDQYFPETHGSFVLRAWLDDGRFARAELIPIRLLEYRPVPAVGSMREAVLDRIKRLSALRGTKIERNGGHGVILPQKAVERVQSLAQTDGCGAEHDLLRSGDFENATFGHAVDRSLKADGGYLTFRFDGHHGHHAELTFDAVSGGASIMPSFFYRIVPGDRITVRGRVATDRSVAMAIGHQQVREGVDRMEALKGEPVVFHQSFDIPAGSADMEFSATFSLEKDVNGKLPSFRPILRFNVNPGEPVNGATIILDDVEVLSATSE